MAEGEGATGGLAMLLLVLAVVAVIGIFAYFMANNKPTTVIQTPQPQSIEVPVPDGQSQ